MRLVSRLSVLLFGLLLLSVPAPVNAQSVQDFTIVDFGAKYELTNEDPQGTLTLTETIQLKYSAQNRGI